MHCKNKTQNTTIPPARQLHIYIDLTGSNASQRDSAKLYYMHAPNAQRYLSIYIDNIPTGVLSPATDMWYDFTDEHQLRAHDLSGGDPFVGYDTSSSCLTTSTRTT